LKACDRPLIGECGPHVPFRSDIIQQCLEKNTARGFRTKSKSSTAIDRKTGETNKKRNENDGVPDKTKPTHFPPQNPVDSETDFLNHGFDYRSHFSLIRRSEIVKAGVKTPIGFFPN
jgi:hypothetical protein